VATPLVVGNLLVVAYHTVATGTAPLTVTAPRLRHRIAVVDIAAHALSAAYPPFDLTADVQGPYGDFSFVPGQAMARGAVVRGIPTGGVDGRVYVAFGNVRDLEPYRGWVFEVDLDVWKAGDAGTPMTGVLPTIQEPDVNCGAEGASGAGADLCGGGIWSPFGPLVVDQTDAGYRLIVPAGNGRLDPGRGAFGNTMVRTGPGLSVDAGCDPDACADFSVETLAQSCIETCTDLFIPRLLPGESQILPASGACAGLGLWDCWIAQDQLDGASTPVAVQLPSGRHVLVYPTKDGHLWLVDFDQMGIVYAHQPLTDPCGTASDPCVTSWSGTVVTQPQTTTIDGVAAVIVPTFMPDTTHTAGVKALKIVEDDGTPQFEVAWQFPSPLDPLATQAFRDAPSRATLATPVPASNLEHAFVVDVQEGGIGRLYAIRTSDGKLAAATNLAGPGYRYTAPLYLNDRIFVLSCESDSGPGYLEAYNVNGP
jgi:hypothetical protein